MKKILGAALLLNMTFVGRANAHPIHTTLTKATVEKNAITMQVRVFADDFSATVAKFAGRPTPRDSSVSPEDVLRYLRSKFLVTSANGASVTLEPCGIKRANELYWLCIRAAFPQGSDGARVRNEMLTELHADQVNIVQLEPPSVRRTMLFTKGSPFAAIAR
jgi:hypothetical protein